MFVILKFTRIKYKSIPRLIATAHENELTLKKMGWRVGDLKKNFLNILHEINIIIVQNKYR